MTRSRRFVALVTAVALWPLAATQPALARAPVIVAAGDIACGGDPCTPERRTARLIRSIGPRAVLALGDLQYPDGSLEDFRSSYDRTWGRFKGRTYPTPGNHEYQTPHADGYFRYFGARAHRSPNDGSYAFDVGRWHLLSINTGDGRPDHGLLRWVRRDLRRDRSRCELAYWHHPLHSSGHEHGGDERSRELWGVLFRAGVDVVLNSHEHNYERFALLGPTGAPRREGIRQFVVGTGGAPLYGLSSDGDRGSQRRIDHRHGVLRMDLHRTGYEWRFVTVGRTTLDRGRQGCHS